MAIKIKRNDAGNCIEFQGSSNPVYWNACLSGEVDSTYNIDSEKAIVTLTPEINYGIGTEIT